MPHGLDPFRHRAFRLFWSGQAVSLVGTWIQQIAQAWLVLELTGDPMALGLVGAAQFAPVLVLGLFGGVAADALPKRTGLLGTQVASLLLALVLGLLTLAGVVEVWHVLVLALALGAVNAFDMPIRQAFVVEMVGREDVGSAVALNSAVFNGTRVIGPAVAGLLIATVGLAACFLLNAASYAAVVVGLLLIRRDELLSPPSRHVAWRAGPIAHELAEGLRYVRDTPATLLAITLVGLVSLFALNFQVVLPLVARDLLGGGPETFGFLAAASGVGSLVSALSLAFGGGATLRRLLLGAAVIGASMSFLAFSSNPMVSAGLLFAAGWGLIAMAATTNTLLQLTTPDVLRGRVMSVYTTVFAGSSPFGNLLTGAIAAVAGVGAALIAGGVLSLGATGAAALWLRRRRGISLVSRPVLRGPEEG
jgi:predicted MFS family arabinose efflux permease